MRLSSFINNMVEYLEEVYLETGEERSAGRQDVHQGEDKGEDEEECVISDDESIEGSVQERTAGKSSQDHFSLLALQAQITTASATMHTLSLQNRTEALENWHDTKALITDWVSRSQIVLRHLKEHGVNLTREEEKSFRKSEGRCDTEMTCVREQSRRQVRSLTLRHLERFLQQEPDSCFEDWILALANLEITKGHDIPKAPDENYFMSSSMHLELWNKICVEQRRPEMKMKPLSSASVSPMPSLPQRKAAFLSPSDEGSGLTAMKLEDLVGAALMCGGCDP